MSNGRTQTCAEPGRGDRLFFRGPRWILDLDTLGKIEESSDGELKDDERDGDDDEDDDNDQDELLDDEEKKERWD